MNAENVQFIIRGLFIKQLSIILTIFDPPPLSAKAVKKWKFFFPTNVLTCFMDDQQAIAIFSFIRAGRGYKFYPIFLTIPYLLRAKSTSSTKFQIIFQNLSCSFNLDPRLRQSFWIYIVGGASHQLAYFTASQFLVQRCVSLSTLVKSKM